MANPIISAVSNAKTRTFLLLMGIVIIVGISVVVLNIGKKEATTEQTSAVASVPRGVESIPGEETTDQYKVLQEQENEQRITEAKESGTSAIATLVGDSSEKSSASLEDELRKALEPPTQDTQNENPLYQQLLEEQNRYDEEQKQWREQRAAEFDQAQALAAQEEQNKVVQAITSNMEGFAKEAFQAWNQLTAQKFVQGEYAKTLDNSPYAQKESLSRTNDPTNGEAQNGESALAKNVLLKAGTIIFAALDTAVNTDEPGPILATVVEGDYKGTKLVGKITKPNDKFVKKITLDFTQMNIPNFPNTISVNAVAIDPNTARTAVASEVDNHYLLRYGSLFASAFMEGYGQAIGQKGTEVTVDGTTVAVQKTELSGREQFLTALGNVGSKWGTAIGENFQRQPTIKVDSGTGIGLLFLKDVTGLE